MWFLTKKSGLLACVILSCAALDADAQSRGGFGNAPPSYYRKPIGSQSANRSFGNAGRSAGGQLNSRFGMRLPGPGLAGNRPTRNSPPVLSNYLNLDPSFSTSFEGQYLMRTVPFDQIDADRQNTARAVGGLQSEVQAMEGGAVSSSGEARIRSGLSTTGHPAGFFNTGSYFPGSAR